MSSRRENWQRRRQGYAPMTACMMQVLTFLLEAKRNDWPFVTIENVDNRTLRALLRHHLIVESKDIDTRYKITALGERTRLAYVELTRRADGLCPNCCERPRQVFSSGRVNGYCKECESDLSRRQYAHGIYQPTAGRMCSRCGKRPIYVRASGRRITYCLHCHNVLKRRAKKRHHKAKLQRIANGEIMLCTKPGCTNPRHHTTRTVLEWCIEHYREWHNAYRRRKALER